MFNKNLFQEKYRIQSTRLEYWNYSNSGYYAITICTKGRIECFGDVIDDEMILNKNGMITRQNWLNIMNHFNNIRLDEFIIMPNHIHSIIEIQRRDAINRVSTRLNKKYKGGITGHNNPMLYKIKLGKIIRWFKGKTSYQIHKNDLTNFAWQKGYYEHIIRNENDLNKACEYIINNPMNWSRDRKNPKNLK